MAKYHRTRYDQSGFDFTEWAIIKQDAKNIKGCVIALLTPDEYITNRQRQWYRGICLKGLSDWSGDTVDEWDYRLKADCGGDGLLKKETVYMGNGKTCIRLSISDVGKKNMTQYIENILSYAITHDLPVTPPDPDLRKV